MKPPIRFGIAFLIWSVVTVPAMAEDKTPAVDPKAAAEAQAQMDKMKAYATPGEAHKVLEGLAGKWNFTSKFRMKPDSQPQSSTGTSEINMIYGGRFLEEKVKGEFGGQPFEGTGITGYSWTPEGKEYQGMEIVYTRAV